MHYKITAKCNICGLLKETAMKTSIFSFDDYDYTHLTRSQAAIICILVIYLYKLYLILHVWVLMCTQTIHGDERALLVLSNNLDVSSPVV